MKSNWEEQQLKEFFRDLREGDERLAPPFQRDSEAVLSRTDHARRTLRVRQFAVTVIALMVVGILVGLSIIRQSFRRSGPTPIGSSGLAAAEGDLADLPWRSTILICQWQSPTDFLLKDAEDPFWKADPSFSGPIMNPPSRARARPN